MQTTYLDTYHQSILQPMTILKINYADDQDDTSVQYVPETFTTPSTAHANRIWTPTYADIKNNLWLPTILWNEDNNSH